MTPTVLLVDDEPSIRLTVGDRLAAEGWEVDVLADGDAALERLSERRYDLVLSDIRLPGADGMQIFARARELRPETDVILMTGFGDVSDAVKALHAGVVDYLLKPFDLDELVLRLRRLAEARSVRLELAAAREKLARGEGGRIVGMSPAIRTMLERLAMIAKSEAPVVVTGESGTGKELLARALHEGSSRRAGPFVAVHCAAFPETLIEAELFGHEKGAFTGAVRRRDGRFRVAHGGTLFLDEIGDIPPQVQVKLLRALQEGEIEPLGSTSPQKVDVRVICATHRNLKTLVAEGRFRDDLYYRINVLALHAPALRERRGDLPILVEHFLLRFGGEGGARSLSPRAWAALSEYPFPGNVRELEHAVRHAVAMCPGVEVDLEHLPADIIGATAPSHERGATTRTLAEAAREFEREYLLRALKSAEGKRTRAAEMLGISRKNLWEKLKHHGIADSDLDE